jgi:hypothetical protein
MLKQTSIPPRGMFTVFGLLAGFALPAAGATDARVGESYGRLPLYFEANRGQTDKDVRFLSRGAGYSLYLTAGEAVLVLTKPNSRGTQARPDAKTPVKSAALRMSLVGAARKPHVNGLEEQPGKANYFIGKDPTKWRTNVPTYAKVHYREVYPGIDLVYYGNQRQLEYDFVLAPGADPKKIVLGFKGADRLEIDAQGDLVLHAAGGDIRQHKPIVYQEIDGIRQEIAGGYFRKGANRIGFKVAAYDHDKPLIIDPVVLSYSTYLGGSDIDVGTGIAVDAGGNAYVTGCTNSVDFPKTPGAFQPQPGSPVPPSQGSTGPVCPDAFVTKLNPQGMAVIYSTYLGGLESDQGFGIAVDADGNAYVTGATLSPNFPTTLGAFQMARAGSTFYDAFVTKLDPTGSALVYSTYLGGTDDDVASRIAVDAAGNAYVTGYTFSIDFPTTAGAFQRQLGSASPSVPILQARRDVFVTKLNPTGSALVYSTYLGGSQEDSSSGIAVDAAGNAYLTGVTACADTSRPPYNCENNFPTTAGAFQLAFGGATDAFVTKLNPTGSALVYSTYLGGVAFDWGFGIAVDAEGSAYVTGSTYIDFPTTPGAFQPVLPDRNAAAAFVTKLDPTGSALVYSTYLGGSRGNGDSGRGIAVDAAGNAYVMGTTSSATFPTTPDAFQPTLGGANDIFVTKLNPNGSALIYSTYLGGSGYDWFPDMAVDVNGSVYVTGETNSSDFPTTTGAFQKTHGGGNWDAFVAKIVEVVPPPPSTP